MLLASQADFEPANPTEGAAALYYEPGDGQGYRDNPMLQARIDQLRGRVAPNNQKLAIWGCGFAYTVQRAVTAGYDAYGFDASAYAVTRAKALLPAAISARIFQRDATIAADVTASRNDAGLKGNTRFALLLTEDLFSCLTDAEVQTALPLLRGACSANLGHMLTALELAGINNDPRVNWKTTAAWKAIVSPPDQLLDVFGNVL
jgi:hypothetical protein